LLVTVLIYYFALAMLLTFFKLAVVFSAIRVRIDAKPVFFVVDEAAGVLASIGVDENTLTVFLVV